MNPVHAWPPSGPRQLLSALAVLIAVGASSRAAAQPVCPTPSLSQCVDSAYRASSCFPTHATHCAATIDANWRAQVPALTQRYRLLPDNLGGTIRQVGSMPPREPGTATNVAGYQGTIGGLVSINQLLERKGYANLSPVEAAFAAEKGKWSSNGAAVASCREFVHERFRDYSEFEAKAGKVAGDNRAFFNAAFGQSGIANRSLYSSTQKKLDPIFDGHKVEKNSYFLFEKGPYPAGQQPYAFNSQAAQKAQHAGARSWYPETDSWHQQMSQQLGNYNDDVLDEERGRQQAFEALLAERDSVWKSYESVEKSVKGTAKTQLDTEVAATLRSIDAKLETALIDADKNGCLNAQSLTRCDWSPRRYLDDVRKVMDARRQPELSRCLRLTGNDFGKTSFIANAKPLNLPGLYRGDYTLNPDLVAEFLAIYGGHVDTLDLPTEPSTGLTRRSGRHEDAGEEGDRTSFAGAIAYGAGWEATWGTTMCEADIAVDGYARAKIWVFGSETEVGEIEGRLATEAEELHAEVDVRLFGSDVYSLDERHPAFLDFQVGDWSTSHTIEGGTSFVIVFVPVSVSAGLAAKLGIEFRLGGEIVRDCAHDSVGIDLNGTIKPYVDLGVTAAIGIGVQGFRVGLRGTVSVAKVSTPLRGSIGLYLTSSNDLFMRMGLRFGIKQNYLDGRISLFAELGPLTGEFTIVRWTGFGGPEVVLFDEHFDVALARL
ncbi:MAG: hypothetical protein ACO1OB_14925 [Archangium sp.]